jgi:Pyruvate/2-oxoacid:ferredoxin oxidoreductase delta subunit/flavodoxin
MKIEIVYFSGTGNTWLIATKLAEHLKLKGAEIRITSLEKEEQEKTMPAKNVDLFGLCFPVHGPGIPINMIKYINELKEGNGQTVFVLTTASMYSGSSAYNAIKDLERKNYTPLLAYNVIMPMNLSSIYFFPIYPIMCPVKIPKPTKAEKIKSKALEKIPQIADWLIKGEKKIKGWDPFTRLITNFSSMLFRKFIRKNRHHLTWTIDNERCSGCELCVKICPRQNIQMTNEGIEFLNRCILCGRCFSFCPEKAILFAHRTKNYLRYQGVGYGYHPLIVKN